MASYNCYTIVVIIYPEKHICCNYSQTVGSKQTKSAKPILSATLLASSMAGIHRQPGARLLCK